jgi:hypothetical protein
MLFEIDQVNVARSDELSPTDIEHIGNIMFIPLFCSIWTVLSLVVVKHRQTLYSRPFHATI